MNGSDDVSFEAYTDPWYFRVFHFTSVLSFLSAVVAFYFILTKSPSSIGSYKWYLLNISISALVYDIHMALVYAPQPLFPALVMCAKGLVHTFNWSFGNTLSFYLMPIFLGSVSLSIMWGLVYRYAVLTGRDRQLHSKLGLTIMALLQVSYTAPSLVVHILSARNTEGIRSVVLKNYPLIQPYFEPQSCTAISFEASPLALAFIVLLSLQYAAITPTALTLMVLSFTALKRQKNMSRKTLRMHRQLLISLIFQVTVPFCTIFAPSTLIAVLIMFEARAS
ncbi:7TM GPCR protein, partial [Aphelenchoides avenae]